MGYRCRDACGLAAAAVAKASGGGRPAPADSGDEDVDSITDDVEMGEFYSGEKGAVSSRGSSVGGCGTRGRREDPVFRELAFCSVVLACDFQVRLVCTVRGGGWPDNFFSRWGVVPCMVD